MKKPVKILLVCFGILALLVLALFIALKAGLATLLFSRLIGVPLDNPKHSIMELQHAREVEILEDYNAAEYTLDDPYVILDPYNMNPLSALAMFNTSTALDITVTVGDMAYIRRVDAGRAEVPILALYPGTDNTVTLSTGDESVTLSILTEPIPASMQQYRIIISEPDRMQPGLTFCISGQGSASVLIDAQGTIRGYLSSIWMASGNMILQLKNGNFITNSPILYALPYYSAALWEFNLLGKIYREYRLPGGVHHCILELPDGNLLVDMNNPDTTDTREDYIVEIDRNTGNIVKSYNFRDILDEKRSNRGKGGMGKIIELLLGGKDWLHLNAIQYDELHNALIISGAAQSAIVSIDKDTANINWILGSHEAYSDEFKPYLLTPKGDNFEYSWAQHDPTLLPDYDNNNDTIDMLVFDNGALRSFTGAGIEAKDNYSRAVHYRVDTKNMTVEQIRQFGKEYGPELYSRHLGSVDLMENGNWFICFGGRLHINGVPTDNILSAYTGKGQESSRILEVSPDGIVVFDVEVSGSLNSSGAGTYRAERFSIDALSHYNGAF
jgi:arylsulfate sulfotransferase